LEARLSDQEIMGMGLIFGRPGLGKSMALDAYHARSAKAKRIRTVKVRAMAHWTEASMLRALLEAVGQEPRAYRKDLMFDQLRETLSHEPAIILIDEIDSIAGKREMIATLKDIHDVTGCGILMIGEERVDGLLRRYESFYNRMNRGALVHLENHSESDVSEVVAQRCDVEVAPEVCAEIYAATGGRSMRSVVDAIRDIEGFARANDCRRIGMAEYRKLHNGNGSVHRKRMTGSEAGPTEREGVNPSPTTAGSVTQPVRMVANAS
jgi:hypothetical protein